MEVLEGMRVAAMFSKSFTIMHISGITIALLPLSFYRVKNNATLRWQQNLKFPLRGEGQKTWKPKTWYWANHKMNCLMR